MGKGWGKVVSALWLCLVLARCQADAGTSDGGMGFGSQTASKAATDGDNSRRRNGKPGSSLLSDDIRRVPDIDAAPRTSQWEVPTSQEHRKLVVRKMEYTESQATMAHQQQQRRRSGRAEARSALGMASASHYKPHVASDARDVPQMSTNTPHDESSSRGDEEAGERREWQSVERWPSDEFGAFMCTCEGGCRKINKRYGRLDDGGGSPCTKSGLTGKYSARATCWWMIIADPGSSMTVKKALIDHSVAWADVWTVNWCNLTASPDCTKFEVLADQFLDTTDAAASTFTSPSGIFYIELKADPLWNHEGFEVIWGPPGARVCGDGTMDPGFESCDDGNAADGDGCSSTCSAEPGYVCDAGGCNCTCCGNYSTANGTITVGRGANGYAAGDKCWYTITSAAVQGLFTSFDVEDGDSATVSSCTAAHVCTAVGTYNSTHKPTGALSIVSAAPATYARLEFTSTGCSGGLGFEFMWGSAAPTCGDGTMNHLEQCDDGNNASNDGCSNSCTVELGYTCAGITCATKCGDGIKAASEQCDDGNTTAGDGCSPTCSCEQTPCAYTVSPACHLGSIVATSSPGTIVTLAEGTYDDIEKHMELHFKSFNVTLVGSGTLARRRGVMGSGYKSLGQVANIMDLKYTYNNPFLGSYFPKGVSISVLANGCAMNHVHFDAPTYVYPSPENSFSMGSLDAQSIRMYGKDVCKIGQAACKIILTEITVWRRLDYSGVLWMEGENMQMDVKNFWCRDPWESNRIIMKGDHNVVNFVNSFMGPTPFGGGSGVLIQGSDNSLLIHSSEVHGMYRAPSGYVPGTGTRRRVGMYDGSGGAVRANGDRNSVQMLNVDLWFGQAEYRAADVFMLGDNNTYYQGEGTVSEDSAAFEQVAGSYMVGDGNTMHFGETESITQNSPFIYPCWDYKPDLAGLEGDGEEYFCYPNTCGGNKIEGNNNHLIIAGAKFKYGGSFAVDAYGGTPGGMFCVQGDNARVDINGSTFERCSSLSGNGGALSITGKNHNVTVASTTTKYVSSQGAFGGAIAVYNSQNVRLHLSLSSFYDSLAKRGGAIAMVGTGMHLDVSLGTTFHRNMAMSDHGGAIYVNDPSAEIMVNSAALLFNAAAGNGGAIWTNAKKINLNNAALSSNKASENGGGIFLVGQADCHAVIMSSQLKRNQATNGGAFYTSSCPLSMTDSQMENNVAFSFGGGVYFDGGLSTAKLTVHGSTFSSNEIQYLGGGAGIYMSNGDLDVSISAFEQNLAMLGHGAGLYVTGSAGPDGTWSVTASSFTENSAKWGAGFYATENTATLTQVSGSVKGVPLGFHAANGATSGAPGVIISGLGGLSPIQIPGGYGDMTDHTLTLIEGGQTTSLLQPDAFTMLYYYDRYTHHGEAWPETMYCYPTDFMPTLNTNYMGFDSSAEFANVVDSSADYICVESSAVAVNMEHKVALVMEQVGGKLFAMKITDAHTLAISPAGDANFNPSLKTDDDDHILAVVKTATTSIMGSASVGRYPATTIQTITALASDSWEGVLGWGLIGATSSKILVGGTFDGAHIYDIKKGEFEVIDCYTGFTAAAISNDFEEVYLSRYMGPGSAFEIWVWNRVTRKCLSPTWNHRLGLNAIRAIAVSTDGSALYLAERFTYSGEMNEKHRVRIVNLDSGFDTVLVQSIQGVKSTIILSNIVSFHFSPEAVYMLTSPTGMSKSGSTKWAIFSISSGVVELVDVDLQDNQAEVDGGGLKLDKLSLMSKIHVTRVNAINNMANVGGGASLADITGQAVLNDCYFTGNKAASKGGAFSSRAVSGLTVNMSSFIRNVADDGGGGLHISSKSDPSVVSPQGGDAGVQSSLLLGVTVAGNSDHGSGLGGGILIEGSIDASLGSHSVLEGNVAYKGGGIYVSNKATLSVSNTTISSGTAHNCGGALASGSAWPIHLMGGVTIKNNTALLGGGAVCNTYSDSARQCLPQAGGSPTFYRLATTSTEAIDVEFKDNTAHGGGGTFFASCLSPAYETTATLASTANIFKISNSRAGWGETFANIEEVFEAIGDVKAAEVYRPGDNLKTKLQVKDGYGNRVKMLGGDVLPYTVSVNLVATSSNGIEKVYMTANFAFDLDGVCDLAAKPTSLKWPVTSDGELVKDMMLRHEISNTMSGLVQRVDVKLTRATCDSGTTYDLLTGTCKGCLPGTEYINFPDTQSCIKCPLGATCDGKKVTGISGSVWELDFDNHTRLQQCPSGYVLVREDRQPFQDQCVECPVGKYLIDVAKWRPGKDEARIVIDRAENAGSVCNDCEKGLVCTGGNRIFQRKGFWALDEGQAVLGGNARRQLTTGNVTKVSVYQCHGEACVGNETCSYPCPNDYTCGEGRYGPVCGLCMEGYVEAMNKCNKCDVEGTERARQVAWGVGVTVAVLVWVAVSWVPLILKVKVEAQTKTRKTVMDMFAKLFAGGEQVHDLDNYADAKKGGGGAKGKPQLVRRGTMSLKQRHGKNSLHRIFHSVGTLPVETTMRGITGYVKIVIGFYQILSTFPVTFFHLNWTSTNDDVLQNSKWSRVEIFSIPDFACLLQGMHYRDKLYYYTIAPVIISAALAVPTFVVLILGKLRSGSWTAHPKYKQVTANYFWSQSFFMFLIYPTVSMMALNGVNCRQIGDTWMLSIDVAERCTLLNTGGDLFILVIASIIMYPIGVPVIITLLLYAQRVPYLAERKKNKALVVAMINHYKLSIGNSETEMLTRYFGAVQSATADPGGETNLVRSTTFHKKVQMLYEQQYVEQADGKRKLDTEEGAGLFVNVGLRGDETFEEFHKKMITVVREQSMFTGHETFENLSAEQCQTLIRHFERANDGEDDLHDVSLSDLRGMVVLCAKSMSRKGKIVVATLTWNEFDSAAERRVLRRVGNLFVAFKVEFWYYEILNTIHKLIMTSVLVFVLQGDYSQFAVGIAIIYAFLLITMRSQPYVIAVLNNLQLYALIILIITLFYGMMKSVNDFQIVDSTRNFNAGMPFTVAVAVLCSTVPIAPFAWETVTGWLHMLHWFKSDKEDDLLQEFQDHHRHPTGQLPTLPKVDPTPEAPSLKDKAPALKEEPAPGLRSSPEVAAPAQLHAGQMLATDAGQMLATHWSAPTALLYSVAVSNGNGVPVPYSSAAYNGHGDASANVNGNAHVNGDANGHAPTPTKQKKRLCKLKPLPNAAGAGSVPSTPAKFNQVAPT